MYLDTYNEQTHEMIRKTGNWEWQKLQKSCSRNLTIQTFDASDNKSSVSASFYACNADITFLMHIVKY